MLVIPIIFFVASFVFVFFVLAMTGILVIIYELSSLFAAKTNQLARVIFAWVSLVRRSLRVAVRTVSYILRTTIGSIAFVIEQSLKMILGPNLVPDPVTSPVVVNAPRYRSGTTTVAVVWCLLIPTLVFTTFMVLGVTLRVHRKRDFVSEDHKPHRIRSIVHSLFPEWKSFLQGNNQPANTIHETAKYVTDKSDRPDWVGGKDSVSGDVRTIVLSSELWSTVDEARTELQSKALKIVEKDFSDRHHRFLDPKRYQLPSGERLEQIAVKETYVEQIEMDFGGMNRVWWLFEVSPVVRTELYSYWKQARNQNRIVVTSMLMATATLLACAGGLYASLRRTSGYSPRAAFTTACGCATAWSVCGFTVASQLIS